MSAPDDVTVPEARTRVTLAHATAASSVEGDEHGRVQYSANRVLTLVDANRTRVGHVRAWMLVLPVDAALLMLPVLWHPQHVKGSVVMTTLFLFLLSGAGRYRARLHLSVLDELPTLVAKLLTAAAVVATITALRHQQSAVEIFLVDAAASIVLVVAGRLVVTRLILWSRRHRLTVHPTILIGGGPVAAELAAILHRHPRYGLKVVGFVDDQRGCPAEAIVPRLGSASDLDHVLLGSAADVLLVADGAFSEHDLLDIVRTPVCLPCDLLIVPRLHDFHTQSGLADHIGSIPIMRVHNPNLTGFTWRIKRAFDVLVVTSTLILWAPVLAACAVAVRIEGGPGVIFRQPRVGRNGALFDCLKFRTMIPQDAAESATCWSIAQDCRVGPVGRFLRRSSLDELPQLLNILRGDMTLVGPRPERPFFVEQFTAEYHRYSHRHRVRAGLTGLAQVSGLRGDTSIADRARYDNYYIENWSLWLDVKILIRTISEVVLARGR